MYRSIGATAAVVAVVLFASVLVAGGDRDKNPVPKDVTLTGRIVDLQSFMSGKFESSDRLKCTQRCIQAGVPAALETEDGLIILGEGAKGPARTIAPLAMRHVELKGKLYEHKGVKYIDVTSAKPTKQLENAEETDSDTEPDAGWDNEEDRGDIDPDNEDG